MKKAYERPDAYVIENLSEGVYMVSGAIATPPGHAPRPGSAVKERLCMWFVGGSNDMTGVTATVTFSVPVKFVEAHNFDVSNIVDGSEVISFHIDSAARMKDGNDDYNFSVDAVNPDDRPSFVKATASGGANVKPV